MYIGKLVKERMEALGKNIPNFANEIFMKENTLRSIVENKTSINEIDECDMDFICSALITKRDYFTNENIRNNDLLFISIQNYENNIDANETIARLQQFADDFSFLNSL